MRPILVATARCILLGAALLSSAAAPAAQAADRAADRATSIADPDTRDWWTITETLSSDAMEGRDIGSPGHERAGRWVAEQFAAAGLKPAGDNGTFFQTFPVHESRVTAATLRIKPARGAAIRPVFLQDFTVRAADDLPAGVSGPMVFGGYCRPADLANAAGKVVFCIATRRQGLTTAAERTRNVQAAGAAALVQVDDPGFTIEPARWPAAYARTITAADAPPAPTRGFVALSMSAPMFERIAAAGGRDGRAALAAGAAKQPLAAFDIPGRFAAAFTKTARDFTATNVLAVLPGSDPTLAAEHVVLSAHLDGYGYGAPVGGDRLYNGTLDDAAYVALLVRFARNHQGRPLKRSVLLAAFTGEEKGLLGAWWFVRHPTVPKASLVADLNLDQLRPLYPLTLLTVHALSDSTLGDDVRAVAGAMNVRVQPDLEPERGLVARADNWPFMQIGVPATGFIFGYEPGTEAERRYREWYQVRYHRPQDDITQPMDFEAAGAFNRFFYTLAERVADAAQRPAWTPGSPYAPRR